ncbi:hypothetical protein QUA56_05475 [Microcoleus sp. N3A4]|uniref:hypothetical protein n=1 Tax=Microcoleus sp. N3A4 TaxID=3055379 RepID=UPI002FD03D39
MRFLDFSVRSGCNSRNRVSQPNYVISTMSLEAEIRFLEFLCIAEGRRPFNSLRLRDRASRERVKRKKLLRSTEMVSAIKNLLNIWCGCDRGSWVDEVHNQT